jgi:ornithine decarboxylase
MELLLRIAIDDRSARCPLSSKFGAPLGATRGLLEKARELDLKVSGVAFHVGSGAEDVSTYVQGLRDARAVFDQAAELGFNFNTLDIGGGFSASSFTDMSPVIIKALDLYFPASPRRPKFIAEPGRFYVENAFTLACQVIARSRAFHTQQETYKLILNDGVYGNLSGIIFDHQNPIPHVLQKGSAFLYGQMQCALHKSSMVRYSLWGPTCDGLDKITEECYFSHVLDIGDWLYFENMGGV